MEILLVDDNAGDRRLMEEAFQAVSSDISLHGVAETDTALKFLHREKPFEHAPAPDLVLLDLNMPGDGRKLLYKIKNDVRLKVVPVAVFTSSSSPDDVWACYHGHANCYLKKPSTFDELCDLARLIRRFWLEKNLHAVT